MNKKNFWIAVGGGFVAGIGAALLVMSCCSEPQRTLAQFDGAPVKMEMRHHAFHKGHHHKGFKPFREPTAEMKAHFAEKLGLTDEQKAQLDKMRAEDMAKMKPLFEEMDNLRAQIRDLRKVNRAHFESVLTDEQKEILKTMKSKWHRHHKHRMMPKDMEDLAAIKTVVDDELKADDNVDEAPVETPAPVDEAPVIEDNAPAEVPAENVEAPADAPAENTEAL